MEIFIVRKVRSSKWQGEEKETGEIIETGSTKKEVVAKIVSTRKKNGQIKIVNEEGILVKEVIRVPSRKYSRA